MRNPNATAGPFPTLRLAALLVAGVSAACSPTANSGNSGTADASLSQDAGADSKLADATGDATASPDAARDTAVPKDVVAGACSPITNKGCENGTHCAYSDTGDKVCEANGTHGVGEDCADNGGCKVGMCVTSPTGDMACAPFCATNAGCDSNGCNQIVGKTYKVCDVGKTTIVPCDPFAQDCKKAGQGCTLYAGAITCVAIGAGAVGEKCESSTECGNGLTCVGGPNGLCHKICHTKGATGCDDALTNCVAFGKDSPYGYCGE